VSELTDWEKQHERDNPFQKIKTSTRAKEKTQGFVNFINNVATKIELSVTSPSYLATWLDRGANYGPWHKNWGDRLDSLQHETAKKHRGYTNLQAKLQRELGIDIHKVEKTRIDLAGYKHTAGEAVLLDLANRKVKGETSKAKSAIMSSNGVTEAEFVAASKYVAENAEAKKLSAYIQGGYAQIFDELSDTYFKVTGKKLGKVPFYFTLIRQDGMFTADDEVMRALQAVGSFGEQKVGANYKILNERKGGRAGAIDLTSPLFSLGSYTTQAATYISKAETVKQISDMLDQEGLQDALLNSYGQVNGAAIVETLRTMTARELYPNAKTEVTTGADRAFKYARTSTTLAALGFRPTVWAAQLLSKPTFYSLVKGALSPKMVMSDITNTIELVRQVTANELDNTRREVTGKWKTEGYKHWIEGSRLYFKDAQGNEDGLWVKHAQHILDAVSNPVTVDQRAIKLPGLANVEFMGKSLGEAALEGISVMDIVTVGSVWMTMFDHVMSNEMKKHGDPVAAEKKAAEVANKYVTKTQPPRTQYQRPLAATGKESVRSLLMFSGQTNVNWNIWVEEVVKPAYQAIASNNWQGLVDSNKLEGAGEYDSSIAQRVGLAFVIPAILMGMRARRRKPTEEELRKDLLFYPIANIPAIGGAINYMFVHESDYATIETAYTRIVNNTLKATYAIAKRATGEKEKFSKTDIRTITDALAVPLAVPTASIKFVDEAISTLKDPEHTWDSEAVLKLLSAPRKPLPKE